MSWIVVTCRFVTVCGDGEYIIYTAMALRNKSFGSAQEFIWSNDSALYAIREGTTSVKLFKNFKEIRSFKPEFGAEGNNVKFASVLKCSVKAVKSKNYSTLSPKRYGGLTARLLI